MTDKIVVLVTCGSLKEARRISRAVVEQRLAACVNVVRAPVESVYQWKGKVGTAKEFLLVIKTSRRRYVALEQEVRHQHSYDVPEIIALPIERGSHGYLAWISASVRTGKR